MKMNKFDDPNYKILENGPAVLSDVEMLSVVISGNDSIERARMLLQNNDNNLNSIAKMSYHDIIATGFTHCQATRVIAMNEYSNRKKIQDMPDLLKISRSQDVFDILSPYLSDLDHEEFWMLFMSRANKVLKKERISFGGLNGTVTDVRVIFKFAINYKASGIICCHNHPSGNLNYSESDMKITQKIKEVGTLMDIQLLDHVIIADKGHYSFADNGVL